MVELPLLRSVFIHSHELAVVHLNPGIRTIFGIEVYNFLERGRLALPRLNLDPVSVSQLVARDIYGFTVNCEMSVTDKLPCLGTRNSEAHSVYGIVEPTLEHLYQPVAGDALTLRRLLVVILKLFFLSLYLSIKSTNAIFSALHMVE